MPTIDVSGTTIAYTDTGAPADHPDAPTVLFGHGLLFGGWMFRPQIDALRDRYRCVAIDWRGQGDTPPAHGGYDMDTLTADAVALITELGIGPVHWVGLSMGGFVGQRLAARHADLLRSLTLLDTSAGPENQAKIGEYRLLAWALRLFGLTPIEGKVRGHLFGPAFLADKENRVVVEEWAKRLRGKNRKATRQAVLGVADRAAIDQEITGSTLPTLVVVGADDQATPPVESERIAATIPGAQLHIVPDCGHTSTLEQPAAITALLTDFLSSTQPA